MKKYLFLISFSFLSLSFLQAQDFKYGVKAGFNVNQLAITPELDYPAPSSRLGVHIGGFAQFDLANNLSIQPELMFSTQGVNDMDEDELQRVKLSYLNFAGMFKYTLENKLYFSLGPQLGFLTGGEFEKEENDGEIKRYNAKSLLKGTDLSLGMGLGYTLESGIDLTLRYNYGLNNINDNPYDQAFYEDYQDIKNRVLQITIGYIFNY